MKVAILGCGPAGLMAAAAAYDASRVYTEPGKPIDLDIKIFSRKKKSPLYGAQYLHQPIPGYTEPDGYSFIRYRLMGDADEYRRKVYGPLWDGTVSPEDLAEHHKGWNIRTTYDMLWTTYSHIIQDVDLDPSIVRNILNNYEPDLIVNSIPLPILCYRGHTFGATEITAAGDAPELGIKLPYECPPSTVLCNGQPEPSWYRVSRVFGHTTVEWPGNIDNVPVQTAARVRKPTYHACDCWPQMFKVGRYGSWKKGVLSHQAYFDTYDKVSSILEGVEEVAEEQAGA